MKELLELEAIREDIARVQATIPVLMAMMDAVTDGKKRLQHSAQTLIELLKQEERLLSLLERERALMDEQGIE